MSILRNNPLRWWKRGAVANGAILVLCALAVDAVLHMNERKTEIEPDRPEPPRPFPQPSPPPPTDLRPGLGGTVRGVNGLTPCPKRPGYPRWWEGSGSWSPCNGNLVLHFLGGLLVYNSQRNFAIHPPHGTGGAPTLGYAGRGFKIEGWDQQLTPDDSNTPPASVTIANGDDGQDVYQLVPKSSGPPWYYEDTEDKHWTVHTSDMKTWTLTTFEGQVFSFTQRLHGFLLTSITDRAGNTTTINLDSQADTITSVVDFLKRTWKFTYSQTNGTSGQLMEIDLPTAMPSGGGAPAPNPVQYRFRYDNAGFDDLLSIYLPSPPQGGSREYDLGYIDSLSQHEPFLMTINGPDGLRIFDWFQDGALINVYYANLNPNVPLFHAEYNWNGTANLTTNLVEFEYPLFNSPKSIVQYNATFNQSTGNPALDNYWINAVTTPDGITTKIVQRNSRHEVTQLLDGLNQTWTTTYDPNNNEDPVEVIDPGKHKTELKWWPSNGPKTSSTMCTGSGPDGASSGRLMQVVETATGFTHGLCWDNAPVGNPFHNTTDKETYGANGKTITEEFTRQKGTVKTSSMGSLSNAYWVQTRINGTLVSDVALGPDGDVEVQRNSLGLTVETAFDGYHHPTTWTGFHRGTQVTSLGASGAMKYGGQTSADLNGTLLNATDSLGDLLVVDKWDELNRVLKFHTVMGDPQVVTVNNTYAADPMSDMDPDVPLEQTKTFPDGVTDGELFQPAAAGGIDDCAGAETIDGTLVPMFTARVATTFSSLGDTPVACGNAPSPPPPPPPNGDGGVVDAQATDSSWLVDAPADVEDASNCCMPPSCTQVANACGGCWDNGGFMMGWCPFACDCSNPQSCYVVEYDPGNGNDWQTSCNPGFPVPDPRQGNPPTPACQ